MQIIVNKYARCGIILWKWFLWFIDIIKKWKTFGSVQDRPRNNKHKLLISDEGLLVINKLLLSNPFVTSSEIKTKLNLVVESKTVGNYIYVLGWRKVNTKYCQIVSPVDRLTRFIYACFCRFTTCVLQDSDILEFLGFL